MLAAAAVTVAALVLLAAHPATAAPWPADSKPAGGCGIAYSPRFSHGGGCSQTSLGNGTPSTYCKSFGKQRAVVRAAAAGHACARLPWRRYDDPARHAVVVTTAAGDIVPSALTDANATVGEVCFTAVAAGEFAVYYLPFRWAFGGGSGSYCSFFLNSTETIHPPAAPNPALAAAASGGGSPTAVAAFVGFESKTAFDTRSPMEMVASPAEVAGMLAKQSRRDYLTFVSPIANTTTQSVRLDVLPLPLIQAGPNVSATVAGAAPGQFVVIQVAVLARAAVANLTVEFGPIGRIPASALTCFQTDGIDVSGGTMPQRPWSLAAGKVGALLIGIAVPEASAALCGGPGQEDEPHTGSFVLRSAGAAPTTISVSVGVACDRTPAAAAAVGGTGERIDTSDLERLERLRWLNSKVGQQATVTRPYHPVQLAAGAAAAAGPELTVLGRTVRLGPVGLPSAITANGVALLAEPMAFEVLRSDGSNVSWMPAAGGVAVHVDANGTTASWSVESRASGGGGGGLSMTVEGSMEYDGYVNLALTLRSAAAVAVADTRLVVTMHRSAAKYACGGGLASDGAFFPYTNLSKLAWKWTDSAPGFNPIAGGPVTGGAGFRVWAGDVEAGLHIKLKGSDAGWNRPAGDPFGPDSKTKPPGGGIVLNPPAWQNGNLGGWEAALPAGGDTVQLVAYAGKRSLVAGGALLFNFSAMATPTKGNYLHTETAKREHYHQFRHYHIPYGQWIPNTPEDLHSDPGATTIILHQSNRLNPYIDWPFATDVMPLLSDYADSAHRLGMHLKMYYTLGQMTNHMTELFALKSMGGEILLRNTSALAPTAAAATSSARRQLGMGNGLVANEWLEEHMVRGYQGGWFTMNPNDDEDASIADDTSSRFLNYYIEGQKWLYDKLKLGGLYYDGNGGERAIQQRIRRMSETLPPDNEGDNGTLAVFDVHGRAFDYVEELPFFDSIWTAEGIDFSRDSDYWLISIASIPFGTFGEMLGFDSCTAGPSPCVMQKSEAGANRWRGMLYGMTNRAGWTGHDPNNNHGVWQLWDEFDIVSASLFGYWHPAPPVRVVGAPAAGAQGVLATSWVRHGVGTLVAIGSWNPKMVNLTHEHLVFDWAAMGLTASSTALEVPALAGFNDPVVGKTIARPACDAAAMASLVVPVSGNKGWVLWLRAKTTGQ